MLKVVMDVGQHTLVSESEFDLPTSQAQQFQRDGHTLVRGLASRPEVATARGAILECVAELNHEARSLAERDTYGKAFLQTINLWRHNDMVRQFVFARRFAKVAAELMGVDGVRLYHDQALFKEPGGGFTPWHQDQHYWPLDTDKTVTLWMPLVDVTADMGTMHFASGSQVEGYLGDLPISDESERVIESLVHEKGYPITSGGAMAAGDATFHSGWCLHGAPGNTQDYTREVMTIIYFADGVRVGPLDNQFRKNDRDGFLPGVEPGEIAATEMNPLLFHG